jgi:aspartyl-tRNA(Asn)/glutamyl-tRNA(Gln) amidotransferase subunit B
MEQGSLRCDANVSLRPDPQGPFGTRTETKNVNSLRSVERAVRHEIERQADVLAAGGTIVQETRHWHEDTGKTTPGRTKEEAEDYRYFPEPDLAPVAASPDWVDQLRETLPEPPAQRRARLQQQWGFTDLEMRDVVNAQAMELIEQTIEAGASAAGAKKWWLGELARRSNDSGVALPELSIDPAGVARIEALVAEGTLNDKMARQVIDGILAGEGSADEVVAARGLAMVSDDTALLEAVDEAIANNADVAQKVRDGKVAAVGALVGAVMKATRGQADAGRVRELLVTRLTGE